MKKALVLTILMAFGVGLAATADGLTGTWDVEITIDPSTTIAGDLFIDLTSTLDIDYALGDWVFGAESTFGRLGWEAMDFDFAGTLGAFTFTGAMDFLPAAITSYTVAYGAFYTQTQGHAAFVQSLCWEDDVAYITAVVGPDFDDLTFTGSVSIAGVSFEGMFFLEGYEGDAVSQLWAIYWAGDSAVAIQTYGDTLHVFYDGSTAATSGSGFRFKLSGTAGGLTITSLTYFNLSEPFAKITCGAISLDKKGSGFTTDDCVLGFTSTYFHIDGFTVGCATFEVGLNIDCDGFDWVGFAAHDIELGVWGLVGDFTVKFTEKTKSVDFCLDFELDVLCFEIGTTLDYADYSVNGFSIDSIELETELVGATITSLTYFDGVISTVTDEAYEIMFMKPMLGMTNGTISIESIDDSGYGYYQPGTCMYTEKWEVWETFTIDIDGDSCCGGAFDFTVEVGMGTKRELDYYAWDYQFDNGSNSRYEFLYVDTEAGDPVYDDACQVIAVDLGDGFAAYDANGNGHIDNVNADLLDWTGSTDPHVEQFLDASIYENATSTSLFAWVYSTVDVSVDIGTAWAVTFGADIDVYGWNGLSFGFEFEF